MLPLQRTAYQTNEWIDFSVVRSDKQPLAAATLTLTVKGADGSVVNWAIEVVAPNALLRRGLRKEDFPIGSEVVVKGYRAKSGRPIANGRTVTFQDGRNFFLGSPDSGAPITMEKSCAQCICPMAVARRCDGYQRLNK